MIVSLKRRWTAALSAAIGFAAATLCSLAPAAAEVTQPWQMTLQPAATKIAERIHGFEQFTLILAFVIALFVLVLLIYVMVKFNAKANPVPSKTTHHTGIEIVWTIAPILILVVICIPSFRLLYDQVDIPPETDMTIKATGYQWYWGYEYPAIKDASGAALAIESRMLTAEAAKTANLPRLLGADHFLVVPVNKTVRVQVTGNDVIHAFAMPSFGVKIDAMPGRLNETWFRAERTGTFYGQCSELCGKDHAFMPIMVKVVTDEQFKAWAAGAVTNLDDAEKKLTAAIEGKSPTETLASR